MNPGNPEVDLEVKLNKNDDFKKFMGKIVRDTEQDSTDRNEWILRQDQGLRQRYGLEFRNPDFPWPNSSDIVMPLTDMIIENLKPAYLGFLSQRPMILFEVNDPRQVQKSRIVEAYFEYQLRHKTNDFTQQMILFVDSVLQHGLGFAKTYWHHESINIKDKVRRSDLPNSFRGFFVDPKLTEEEANEIWRMMGGQNAPVTPLTLKGFDAMAPAIRDVVLREFRLDDEQMMERKSADSVMKVLRGDSEFAIVHKRDTVNSSFRTVTIDPHNIIVPAFVTDIEEAPRITHRLFYTEPQLKARSRDLDWDKDATEHVMNEGNAKDKYSGIDTDINFEVFQQEREGSSYIDRSELWEVWETYGYYDYDGDGQMERVVVTHAPDSKRVLKMKPMPYQHGQWPFTVCQFEKNIDGRLYATRGVPEKCRDFQIYINGIHRAKMNRLIMETAPVWLVNTRSQINAANLRFIPGQTYPVDRPDAITQLQIQPMGDVFQSSENVLRAWVEQYLGSPDYGQSGVTSSMGEPRTAREISALIASKDQKLGTKMLLFREALRRIANQMWDLEQQYGREDVQVNLGDEGYFRATREQIQGNYDISPNAPIGASDPGLQSQSSIARIQTLMQLAPIMQSDRRWKLDLGQAVVDWLEREDFRAARRIVLSRTPEELKQFDAQMERQSRLSEEERLANIAAKRGAASGAFAKAEQTAIESRMAPEQQPEQGPGFP